MRQIPFFNYPALFAEDEPALMPIIHDVLRRGAYIMQKDLAEFEANLASYLGVKHVIGVADGTNALVMGLRAAGIGAGDEVIVPSHTFVASVAAIHHVGATPVLVDCGRDHLIDPDDARRAITSRTRGVMPVQLNGRTADMDSIGKLAEEHGLEIVEDSCQALGSKFRGRYAGTFGAAGTFSFYPSKTLGAFGDAGAVVTDDDDVAEQVRLMRDHGRNGSTGEIEMYGYNGRLDNLQAAILNFKLSHYDRDISRRRSIAAMYDEALSDVPELFLPPAPGSDPDHYDIFQNYEIEAERRDELRNHLEGRGVKTILQWGGKAVHQYRALGFDVRLHYTENMTEKFMLLPMNTSLSDEDVLYICDTIRSFYGR